MLISIMDELNYFTTKLQGYLDAISRLSKGQVSLLVKSFEIKTDIESSLINAMHNLNFSITSKAQINYEQVESFLKKNIYIHLNNLDSDQIGLIDRDIQEFFGLISASLGPNADFHPLVSNVGYELTVNFDNQNSIGLLVIIQNYGIVVFV